MRINNVTTTRTLPLVAVAALCTSALVTTTFGAGRQSVPANSTRVPEGPSTQTGGGGVAGVTYTENFETFTVGAGCGQNGWTGFCQAAPPAGFFIIDDPDPGFATRSAQHISDGSAVAGFEVVGPVMPAGVETGRIDADIVISAANTLYQFLTVNTVAGFFNTRLNFETTGAINALTVDPACTTGSFLPTTGTWAVGVKMRIGIEVPGDGSLKVYKDNVLIYTGLDIAQVCAPAAIKGINQVRIFAANAAAGLNTTMVMDNIASGGGTPVDPCLAPLPHCPADMTGPGDLPNGIVNVDDLLKVINGWGGTQVPPGTGPRPSGDCAPGPGAGPGNCLVNVDDLLKVINSWGLCPPITGACCFSDGSCLPQTSAACATNGGTYRGNFTTCPPTPPCPITPTNDECTGRIALVTSPFTTVSNAAATTSVSAPPATCTVPTPNGNSNFTHDLWYNYTATCTGNLTIDTCATTGAVTDTVLAVYSGDCSSMVLVGCDDDACTGNPAGDKSRIIMPVTIGTVYRVRVGTWGASPTGPITISFSCAVANDDFCADATALGGAYPLTASDTLENATAESPQPPQCGTPPIQPGIGRWYTCIGNGNTLTATTCGSPAVDIYDMRISIYCGSSCSSLVCVDAINTDNGCTPANFLQETISWCSAPGQMYWICVWYPSEDGQVNAYVLDVTSGAPCGPAISCANLSADECDIAATYVFGPNNINNTGATTSVAPDPGCVVGGAAQFTRDIWGTYTATATGSLQIDTCATAGAVTDTVLAVYSGACSALVNVACDDDACTGNPAGDRSKVVFNAVNGVAYKIRTGSWGATPVGAMVLTIGAGPPPLANDLCANAIDITASINGPAVAGTNAGASPVTGPDPELPAGSPTCQWNGNPAQTHNTVWYRFVCPAGGAVTIETCSSAAPFNDSILALYSGNCGALTQVGCGEDDCPTPNAPPYYSRITASALTVGATYRIMVANPGGWGGSTPGAFQLLIAAGVPQGACCVNGVCVATNTQAQCQALFGSWNTGQTCPAFSCPVVVSDCPGATYFQNHTPPAGAWAFNTSDVTPAFLVTDDFPWNVANGNITKLRIWGIDAVNTGGFVECVENPAQFNVIFYADNAGVPGAAIPGGTYNAITPTQVATGELYAGFANNRYDFTFGAPINPGTGRIWVSVQGLATGASEPCWFLWLNATNGNGIAFQGATQLAGDQSMCINAP